MSDQKNEIDTSAVTGAVKYDAPGPQDHYKRGYAERTHYRVRDNEEILRSRGAGGSRGPNSGNNNNPRTAKLNQFVEKICENQGFGQSARKHFDVFQELDRLQNESPEAFQNGKCLSTILSLFAKRRNMDAALDTWKWMEQKNISPSIYHYNSMLSVCDKCSDFELTLDMLDEMDKKGIQKNAITFSTAIASFSKRGKHNMAFDMLERMERECDESTISIIAYNAAITACEKAMDSKMAFRILNKMRRKRLQPNVITYSSIISVCEKCGMWKLALSVLNDLRKEFGPNVVAYSASIAALSKGQQWQTALDLFRELQDEGLSPSVVTYNTTMTALEKGLQWEKALDLFDEMKRKNLPITVVSFGSAISACEKGQQYQQCLDYLDEMTERGIEKNVIIFGAAMACMEKCKRADIAFQLMERMKLEGIRPNVHIYNCAIGACVRCNMPEKAHETFLSMEDAGIKRDVVTYNTVLDALCRSNPDLSRSLFLEGLDLGFYSKIAILNDKWLELDLHYLSLGSAEVAMLWFFSDCIAPYLVNNSKLSELASISIVTGYGKGRKRDHATGDSIKKRIQTIVSFMNLTELQQPNMGRIELDMPAFAEEVRKNEGKVHFDLESYTKFVEEEMNANPEESVEQKRRPKIPVSDERPMESNDDYSRNNDRNFSRRSSHGSSDYGRKRARSPSPGNVPYRQQSRGMDDRRLDDRRRNNFTGRGRGRGRGRGGGRGRGFGKRNDRDARGGRGLKWEAPPSRELNWEPPRQSGQQEDMSVPNSTPQKRELKWEAPKSAN